MHDKIMASTGRRLFGMHFSRFPSDMASNLCQLELWKLFQVRTSNWTIEKFWSLESKQPPLWTSRFAIRNIATLAATLAATLTATSPQHKVHLSLGGSKLKQVASTQKVCS